MLHHRKAKTTDPMLCSSLFIDRIAIPINRHYMEIQYLHL